MKAKVLKIKAWDRTEKLMVRLSALDCKKGVLTKEGFDIFLFTGTQDQNKSEIYDGDILLYTNKRYVVSWNARKGQWQKQSVTNKLDTSRLTPEIAQKTLRLCHSYESQE